MNNFENFFKVLEKKNYGGAINHMLLHGIVENFEKDNSCQKILKLLMTFEEILEKNSVINSDFTFTVGNKLYNIKHASE